MGVYIEYMGFLYIEYIYIFIWMGSIDSSKTDPKILGS